MADIVTTIVIINRIALRNNDFKHEIHISSLFLLSETRSQVITILTEIRKWRLRSFAYGCEQKKYGEQRENEGTRRRGRKKRGEEGEGENEGWKFLFPCCRNCDVGLFLK